MEYGYARVSTREQNLDRQIAALMDAGVQNARYFLISSREKILPRPQYQQ